MMSPLLKLIIIEVEENIGHRNHDTNQEKFRG